MDYLWTEDTGAGFHYWQLVNEYLFGNTLRVESKGSNQGILDAVRELKPLEKDRYFIAFDIVYDNMDIMNKYLELREFAERYEEQIWLLDMTCFEYVILSFCNLIEWTGTNKKDKIAMRERILRAFSAHRIDIDCIYDAATLHYLMGFKRYSTEKVLKSITMELTENDEWSVKGGQMGRCWYKDCCVRSDERRVKCHMTEGKSGADKIMELLRDQETQRITECMRK